MGSSQSTPAAATQSSPTWLKQQISGAEIVTDGFADPKKPDSEKRKSQKMQKRSGYALVEHKCRRKKRAYDSCYAELYGGFLLAKETDSSGCDEVFEDWRLCILQGMKKDREKRGLPPPNKESILAELGEND